MRPRTVLRAGAALAGVLLVFAVAAPAFAVPTGWLAGYLTTPVAANPTPTMAHVDFAVPKITCPGVPPVPSAVMAGDAIIDYPVAALNGAIWGGVVLACVVSPTRPVLVPSYSAQAYSYTPLGGTSHATLFAVAPGDKISVTTTVLAVTVTDLTSGATATAALGPVGAGQAAFGVFCPPDWFPGLVGACPASPKFKKVKFTQARVNGLPLGAYAPILSTIVGAGFTITPTALRAGGTAFTDIFA